MNQDGNYAIMTADKGGWDEIKPTHKVVNRVNGRNRFEGSEEACIKFVKYRKKQSLIIVKL